MAIEGYTRDALGRKIAQVVSPAQPIKTIEMLKGREKELQTIERALYAPGRNVFIYARIFYLWAPTAAVSVPRRCTPSLAPASSVASIARRICVTS
jgi:hypothetical protein